MKPRNSILTFILVLCPFLAGCGVTPEVAKVTQVIDDDTIVIEGGYQVIYIGIDALGEMSPFTERLKKVIEPWLKGK